MDGLVEIDSKGEPLVDRRYVLGKLNVTRNTLTRMIKLKQFLAPIRFSGHIQRWRQGEVDAWIIAARKRNLLPPERVPAEQLPAFRHTVARKKRAAQ